MLTLFSIPKAFQGRFHVIQMNAIRSWARLQPRPEIILLGDDAGTGEVAKEVGAIHIPHVERSESGTPLVNSLFAKAESASSNQLMCLVLADIILTSDFMRAVNKLTRLTSNKPPLMVGRKTIVEIPEFLDFAEPDWESKLKRRAAITGKYGTSDTDYWLFRRGLWTEIPPFAIGRYYWSAWLTHTAYRRGALVVDATSVVTAVESAHDYSHIASVGGKILQSPDVAMNAKLFRGSRFWTTASAPYILTRTGLRRRSFLHRLPGVLLGFDHQLGLDFRVYGSMYHRIIHSVYRFLRPLVLRIRSFILNRALQAK